MRREGRGQRKLLVLVEPIAVVVVLAGDGHLCSLVIPVDYRYGRTHNKSLNKERDPTIHY